MEILVPFLPESVTTAKVVLWRHKLGEWVKAGQPLVELETDKVILEVPASVDGVLTAIAADVGAVLKSEALLGVITEQAAPPKKDLPEKDIVQPHNAQPPVQAVPSINPVASPEHTAVAPPTLDWQPNHFSPSARRELGEGKRAQPAPTLDAASVGSAVSASFSGAKTTNLSERPERPERREPMSSVRLRTAERLLAVEQQTARLTTFNEVDLKALQAWRERHRETFQNKHQVKLGWMSFFVKAVTQSLQAFPIINASIEDKTIVYHDYCDVGVAVSTERGLVVPILRDAQRLSLAEIERKIAAYGDMAKNNRLQLADLTGGTFTITNGGIFGSLSSTPILNPPQSAILGMHAIQDRAVVREGQIVIRPMMYLALSYDHRLIDGKDSVSFLRNIKILLEEPERLFLEL